MNTQKFRKQRLTYRVSKRIFDILFALLLLPIFAPLMLIIAILIKLDSKGPVFFVQNRVGENETIFSFYKFRSMFENAEKIKQQFQHLNEMSGPVFKISNDPRITPIGKFLRKTSLDEIPQLFNILKGEMSFVGPRPPLPEEVLKYENWQKRRLSVLPGLTCTWQVSGRSSISDFDAWVKMDLDYIDKASFWLDLKIILKTIPAVLFSKGAY